MEESRWDQEDWVFEDLEKADDSLTIVVAKKYVGEAQDM